MVGELTNQGTVDVENADVVAILYDSSHNPLGYARGYIENVAAGATKAFQIDTSFAEIKLTDVAQTEVFGSPWEF